MGILKESVLVVKDHHSRFIWARLTPNKECKTVIRFLTRYLHTFDRPSVVLSYGGPCFGPEFTKFLEAYHIQHHLTSAHYDRSNGDVEAGVKSIKSILIKIGKVTNQLVAKTAFDNNNQLAPSGQGTPAEMFFSQGSENKFAQHFQEKSEHRRYDQDTSNEKDEVGSKNRKTVSRHLPQR